jgi:mono/diheme cytochrome c family protein
VKQISFLVVGSVIAFAGAPAPAQDFTAGKTPAQLFSSDCAECHRSPNGLARGRDVRSLAGFLREHYTTKSDTAGALAAYVSGFSAGGPANVRNRGGGTPPANAATGDRRIRRDVEPPPASEDSRTTPKPVEEPAVRRRRASNLSGDGEKRRVRSDDDTPRPRGGIAASAGSSASHDAADPITRLRSYLSSGLGRDGAASESGKKGTPKSRKNRGHTEIVEPSKSDAPATAKATDAPPADVVITAPPPEDNAATAPRQTQ